MAYTDQEKASIIAQYKQGRSAQNLSAECGICVRTIYRWAKLYSEMNSSGKRTFTAKEYDMLVRRVSKLENIIAVLKAVNCTVHDPLKKKLHELELLYGQYDVHTLCEALDVSRGTFYNHILRNKRGNTWFERRREEYRILIQEVFDEYHQVLGAEKIRTILMQRGYQVSTKFVADRMREMGLTSVRTTAKQDYLKLREPEKKNVLRQQFHADTPNQIWVSDVTCFKLGNRCLYTCVILDLFSRKVVAYKLSKKNSTQARLFHAPARLV
ncbi:MAG: IS3 family transposase [Clostridiales bacterium]|nr:IS3 family transposase [Clostridiales bacterium]